MARIPASRFTLLARGRSCIRGLWRLAFPPALCLALFLVGVDFPTLAPGAMLARLPWLRRLL
jgi:hypothetical protein